jgi:hypothetical protein
MTTTLIEIADTAVKIGLGATISSFATYFVAHLNHRNGVSKDLINKKVAILEEISKLAEEYFYFCTALSNKVGGMLRTADNAGRTLTSAQQAAISKEHERFKEILSKRNLALSKVKLLRIPKAEVAMRRYNDVLGEFRDIVVFSKVLMSEEKRNELADRFSLEKDAFYEALSDYMAALER